MKKALRIIYILIILLFFGILLLTFLSLVGIPENFKIYVVETGSMEPNLPKGSLAFVSPNSSYSEGEVITFLSKLDPKSATKYVVTHRIVDVTEVEGTTLYQTKGDANADVDPVLANDIDVIGKVNSHVPYVGYVVGLAKSRTGFILLILIPSILLIVYEFSVIFRELRKKKVAAKSIANY